MVSLAILAMGHYFVISGNPVVMAVAGIGRQARFEGARTLL